ncbi:hypothetical protein [Streptomyces sp. SM11]|uniref:hypothetical protein n=1 Tax=Streptomyces sp. SM11 TaxID=565557 RepID=UPI000CD57DDA|nr:hypothetical protein [Streptomyces sp. SM11]
MRIAPVQRTETDGRLELSVEVSHQDGVTTDRLWFRVDPRHVPYVTDTMDPFLLATLFLAMRKGENLHVEGPVSATLLENLEEFQAAWVQWRPERYSVVELSADQEVPDREGPDTRSALQTFSGGVDSAFTTIRHVKKEAGRGSLDLTGAVMVHGYDIPLEELDAYRALYTRSVPLLRGVGVELLPVTTNFRELWHSDLSHWEDAFATGMTSVLTLFSGRFQHGVIASSEPYGSLVLPWGSNPMTDWMLSGGRMRMHHDATGIERSDKVAGLARLWPEGADNLRVCWQGEQKDRNCCQCEKCIRTILNFKVSDSPLPPSFPHDVTPEQIRSLRGLAEAHINPLRQILATARRREVTADWVAALADCIAANEDELARGISYEGGFPLLATAGGER